MLVTKRTHEAMKKQFNSQSKEMMIANAELTIKYDALERSFNKMEALYDGAIIELERLEKIEALLRQQDAWMRAIILPANGKNRRELSRLREALHAQVMLLNILIEETPAEEQEEEQSA